MNNFNIWEGVYASFNEVPSCGQGFDSQKWLTRSEQELSERLEVATASGLTDSPLPIVASILGSTQKTISCLDFGGGLGHHYLTLKESIMPNIDLNYTVIEGTKSCEIAEKYFTSYNDIKFIDTLPSFNLSFDIVHSSSSMQYIDDWKDLLKAFTAYTPKYFIFSDLVAGNNEAFITHQNYYESKIPYRFFNLVEFISTVEDFGYKLIYQSNFFANTLNQYAHIEMNNFPVHLRVGFAKNLIFSKVP